MKLEQSLEMYKPMQRIQGIPRVYRIEDLISLNAVALYTGDSSNPIVSGNRIVIPYGNELGFELHDTFKADRFGNLYDGHSTSNLKKGRKLRINTDSLKARKDSSFSDE